MFSARRTAIAAVLLAGLTLLIYAPGLDFAPIYLKYEEVFFALESHAIASTLHDTHGRLLPVYFQVYDNAWYQPALVYFTAMFFTILPVSDATLRFPTVVVGAIDIVLIYLVGRRLFKHEATAVCAAILLILTPAHFIQSRLAMDYVYPVPFALAWLLCVLLYLERPSPGRLFIAATCLGLGMFSYIAAVGIMPVYFLVTIAVVASAGRAGIRQYAAACAGFVWPMVLAVPFVLAHPEYLTATASRYGPASAIHGDAFQRLRELFNYANLSERVAAYFDFFNPGYLFLSGGSNPVDSTRAAGVFALPIAVFCLVGIYQIVRRRYTPIEAILLVGFATAPIAAVTIPERYAIDRELVLLPYGILLAVVGVEYLWSAPTSRSLRMFYLPLAAAGALAGLSYAVWTMARQGRVTKSTIPLIATSCVLYAVGRSADRQRRWRPIAAALLVLVPLQFGYFYADYFTRYRVGTAMIFGGNLRGALEEVLAREPRQQPPAIYLSRSIPFVDYYWRLYIIKHRREDLLRRTEYFDSNTLVVGHVPARSLLVLELGAPSDQALVKGGGLTPVKTALEPDNTAAFGVFQR
jgi:4-amino-4-deoxy-L-arabinose transferase-like glycosyltransferase